jgi:hypothetical protein
MRLISPWNLIKIRCRKKIGGEALPDDGRGKALGVVEHEPLGITEGRPLMGGLVEEPCEHV